MEGSFGVPSPAVAEVEDAAEGVLALTSPGVLAASAPAGAALRMEEGYGVPPPAVAAVEDAAEDSDLGWRRLGA